MRKEDDASKATWVLLGVSQQHSKSAFEGIDKSDDATRFTADLKEAKTLATAQQTDNQTKRERETGKEEDRTQANGNSIAHRSLAVQNHRPCPELTMRGLKGGCTVRASILSHPIRRKKVCSRISRSPCRPQPSRFFGSFVKNWKAERRGSTRHLLSVFSF